MKWYNQIGEICYFTVQSVANSCKLLPRFHNCLRVKKSIKGESEIEFPSKSAIPALIPPHPGTSLEVQSLPDCHLSLAMYPGIL